MNALAAAMTALAALVLLRAYRLLKKKKETSAVRRKYDGFLSFRGEDTRRNFTDFLYNSLAAEGIRVFRNDDELRSGEQIGPDHLEAIRNSRIAIPIISKDYARSEWCLRELAEIMDCHRKHGQSVFPIFYEVDVVDVCRQSGNFEEALREHERQYGSEEVLKWREALTSVARIKGWTSQAIANGHEGLVEMVSTKVLSDLKSMRMPMIIKSGKDVACEIHNAIDHSNISILILSENYTSSRWCLDDLAQIVDCRRTKGQKILPIFYKVKPSQVQDASLCFWLQLKDLEDESAYERWARALREVGSCKEGWESEQIADGHEGKLVKKVVKEVSRLLTNP